MIPGGTRENDGLETGIMGGRGRGALTWALHCCDSTGYPLGVVDCAWQAGIRGAKTWQPRYFTLHNCVMRYYKDKPGKKQGRGSLSLSPPTRDLVVC